MDTDPWEPCENAAMNVPAAAVAADNEPVDEVYVDEVVVGLQPLPASSMHLHTLSPLFRTRAHRISMP